MLKKNNDKFSYRIYYEDTDSGGVVYYANYLKFYERARTDFLRSLDISQQELANNQKTIFVVRHCSIDYLTAARLDDLIDVSVKIVEINKVSLIMKQEIFRLSTKISQLQVELVCLNSDNFKPTKIPQKLLDYIYV